MYAILTVLIIWKSVALINIIKVMGSRLAKERQRLNILMISFAIAYVGTSVYYIVQVITKVHCTYKMECTRFTDLMYRCGVQVLFDITPTFILYYQHY